MQALGPLTGVLEEMLQEMMRQEVSAEVGDVVIATIGCDLCFLLVNVDEALDLATRARREDFVFALFANLGTLACWSCLRSVSLWCLVKIYFRERTLVEDDGTAFFVFALLAEPLVDGVSPPALVFLCEGGVSGTAS